MSISPLSPAQVERYSRHLIMPNVGSRGQRALLDSKVLIIGAGGLGSPVSLYLALAGVGNIGIVDFDVVDVSNLQRQILHTDSDVGKRKVESAKETLLAHNPDINVTVVLLSFKNPSTLILFVKSDAEILIIEESAGTT